jgi:hypothetical protein
MVYLQISLKIPPDRRPAAAEIYGRYKAPFLASIAGARSKELLVRDDDVQVLHGFDSKANAEAYLKNPFFERDVVAGETVEVLPVVNKSEAQSWLAQFGSPE